MFDLPKKMVGLYVKPETTDKEMAKLTNKLAQVAGESNVFAFNVKRFNQDFSKNMIILQAASWIVSVALFLLTFF
jgi:spermidine/putrescine-binding protein